MFGKKKKSSSDDNVGFLNRLRSRINQGNSWLTYDLANLAPGGKIDEAALEDLEAELVMADVGVDTAETIMTALHKRLARSDRQDGAALRAGLKEVLVEILEPVSEELSVSDGAAPFVILMVGVNGAGKTTSIGKLARRFLDEGKTVMLAAGDTFRAAAVEQLKVWGDRHDVPVVAQHDGADPAAVIYDAYAAARAKGVDVLLADTAGRLQNQQGLMDELTKIKRVLKRHDENAPHEVMLVIDATQGQNGLVQADKFHAALGLTGITVTKLDGSAKGGILLSIANKLQVPVRFIGIGEKAGDMQPFDAGQYVDALLGIDE